MNSLLNDLRFAFRLLRRDRTFTLTALVTLAVCIASNVAVFSIVNSVVLSPLPFPESDRILTMYNSYPGAGAERAVSGVPDYYDRLTNLDSLYEEQAVYDAETLTIDAAGSPRRVRGLDVTPSFFRLLQVSPWKGRFFQEEESVPGAEQKVILSYPLWQQLFGGSDTAVGQTLRLDDVAHEIIGVTPRDFLFIDPDLQLFRPLAFTDQEKGDDRRHSNNYENIGRLRPGATIDQVRARLAALIEINHERFPQFKPLLINAGYDVKAIPLKEDVVGDVRDNLVLLWAGVLCVLLIGVVNVANLSLARSSARSKEIATRLAVGATSWRLTRQLITESLVLGLGGGVAGLALGAALLRLISSRGLTDLPRGSEIGVDSTVMLASLGLVVALALFLGILPLVHALRVDLTSVFREDSRTGTAGRGTLFLRHGLVVAQVALAFLLLIGAGLLFASFQKVLEIDPGFEADRAIATARLTPPEIRYPGVASLRDFTQRVLTRARTLPGVAHLGATSVLPFGSNSNSSVIVAEGYEMEPGESLVSPAQAVVTTDYFQALGVPLIEGRYFDEGDIQGALSVIIVDRRLAEKFWPGESPLGRRMFLPSNPEDFLAIDENTPFFTVVGVVGNVKQRTLVDTVEPVGACYFSYQQDRARGLTYAIRSADDRLVPIDSFRRIVHEIDAELPVYDVFTMAERVDSSLTRQRTPMLLSLGFGAVALLLAAVGIYGVLAYLVAQRTREIGIRMALGSDRWGVFGLVFRQGAVVLVLGFVLGGVCFAILSRYLTGVIYGVSPFDPGVILIVSAVLGMAALLACLAPARRATRIDPVRALGS